MIGPNVIQSFSPNEYRCLTKIVIHSPPHVLVSMIEWEEPAEEGGRDEQDQVENRHTHGDEIITSFTGVFDCCSSNNGN